MSGRCVREYLAKECNTDEDRIPNLGRRQRPGMECECSRELGFIEGNDGHCHLEYLQGPCQEGEQLVQGSQGAQCRYNNCTQGKNLFIKKVTHFLASPTFNFNNSGTICQNHLKLGVLEWPLHWGKPVLSYCSRKKKARKILQPGFGLSSGITVSYTHLPSPRDS